MDHLEPAIFPLTAQSDLIQHKKARQLRQITTYTRPTIGDVTLGSRAVRVIVEPKLLHHVRIAPLRQAAPLAASSDLALRGARVLPRKLGREIDQARAHKRQQPAHSLHIALRSQRQKTAQSRQFQSLHMAGARLQQGQMRGFQSFSHLALQPDETAASMSRETRICAVSS